MSHGPLFTSTAAPSCLSWRLLPRPSLQTASHPPGAQAWSRVFGLDTTSPPLISQQFSSPLGTAYTRPAPRPFGPVVQAGVAAATSRVPVSTMHPAPPPHGRDRTLPRPQRQVQSPCTVCLADRTLAVPASPPWLLSHLCSRRVPVNSSRVWPPAPRPPGP